MPSRSTLMLIIVACLALAWWLAHPPGANISPETRALLANAACPLPPRVPRGEVPLQTQAPASLNLPSIDGAKLTPLAGFSVDARVLGRENYYADAGAKFSPVDLTLGWGRMREDAVLDKLSITQGGRFFYYRWQHTPPIPVDEIVRSASNMHIIPATPDVARALDSVKSGDRVLIDGWLVRIDRDNGWHWVSSLSRTDSGDGACELIYTCAITRE